MPKQCAICEKTSHPGNQRKLLRGHYNITARRMFRPNLQKTKIDGKSVLACTKCIRNLTRPKTKAE